MPDARLWDWASCWHWRRAAGSGSTISTGTRLPRSQRVELRHRRRRESPRRCHSRALAHQVRADAGPSTPRRRSRHPPQADARPSPTVYGEHGAGRAVTCQGPGRRSRSAAADRRAGACGRPFSVEARASGGTRRCSPKDPDGTRSRGRPEARPRLRRGPDRVNLGTIGPRPRGARSTGGNTGPVIDRRALARREPRRSMPRTRAPARRLSPQAGAT